jgi:UDP-N-acetylmuramate dehydrogenase
MKRLIDFSKYSSIKIGTSIEVEVIEEKRDITDGFLVGGANNLLISPTPPKLYILGKEFDFIKLDGEYLKIGGATKSGRIFSFCKKHNISGLEYLGKLPGTLGGLVKMNAGMKSYEIFNNLVSVSFADREVEKKDIHYGYRYTNIDRVIFSATFRIKKGFDYTLLDEFTKMRTNQPKLPSAGSVFKNPNGDYAGRLIEAVGLKGVSKGGAMWSETHANFLVNKAKATFEDAKWLLYEAKRRVFEEFGIKLEKEIIVLT